MSDMDLAELYKRFERNSTPQIKGSYLDIEAYCQAYGIETCGTRGNGSSTLYLLKTCPFNSNHTNGEAALGQDTTGKLFFTCFHDSCRHTWKEAREIISGTDDLTPYMRSDLSNCPPIYSTRQKDSSKTDPLGIMRTGSELQKIECPVSWVWDKQIPKQSITLFSGKGGVGKTWLTLGIGDAVTKGEFFLGLQTEKMPVYYIDFENSLPVLVDRVKRLEIAEVLFWHNSDTIRPPKIDSQDFDLYKRMPPGLIVFDTLRASQTRDENDSRDMAQVMGKLKELRDMGFTVLLLHHTPKSSDRTYKGSTAIFDLSDHVIGLYRVKKGTSNEVVDADDDEEDRLFRLGTRDKTRYEPFHMFIQFDPERGFILAPDPDTEIMELMHAALLDRGKVTQQAAFDIIKETLGMRGKEKVVRLLGKGEGQFWSVHKDGKRKLYEARETVQLSMADPDSSDR